MSRRSSSIEPGYFDALYAADPDPWRFTTSDYEREKYGESLAALPKPFYEDALEVGCSIGIFTQSLARRCGNLLAVDVADQALAQARQNCPAPNVIFEKRRVPQDWPQRSFDLIVLSEVLYYLDTVALSRVARQVFDSLRPGGNALLVHYLGETDYPLSGDDAAEHFLHEAGLEPTLQLRRDLYRLDALKK
jgi:SAM-dependent methyltransferase